MSYNHLHGIFIPLLYTIQSNPLVFRVASSRKVIVVANQKGNAPDSLGTRLRGLLEELERLISPPQPKRVPVPIPVPVRSPRPTRRDPYGR